MQIIYNFYLKTIANNVLPKWGLTSKLQQLRYYETLVLNSADVFQITPLQQCQNRFASP